nr:MAG TPA: hypothetical protein [Caudoviricetes sp.]
MKANPYVYAYNSLFCNFLSYQKSIFFFVTCQVIFS